MRVSKLDSVETGILYLDEIQVADSMVHDMNGGTIQRGFRAEFSNSKATVAFLVPETMIPELVGCDAIAVDLYTVHVGEDGE